MWFLCQCMYWKMIYTWQWIIHLAPPAFISALLSMPVYMVGCIWCLEKTPSVVHQLVTSLLEVSSIISDWLHWKLLQNSFTWFPSDVECTKHREKNDRSESGTSHLIRLCAPSSYCLVCIVWYAYCMPQPLPDQTRWNCSIYTGKH